MPAVTGLLFVPVLLLSMFMLWHTPPPTKEDIALRTSRAPMDRRARRDFVRQYFPGIVMLVFGYLCLMAYRNIRDDFMDLILKDLGHDITSHDFASIESYVGLAVIGVLCLPLVLSRQPPRCLGQLDLSLGRRSAAGGFDPHAQGKLAGTKRVLHPQWHRPLHGLCSLSKHFDGSTSGLLAYGCNRQLSYCHGRFLRLSFRGSHVPEQRHLSVVHRNPFALGSTA